MRSTLLAFVPVIAMTAAITAGQAKVEPVNDRPNPYRTVENYFKRDVLHS